MKQLGLWQLLQMSYLADLAGHLSRLQMTPEGRVASGFQLCRCQGFCYVTVQTLSAPEGRGGSVGRVCTAAI